MTVEYMGYVIEPRSIGDGYEVFFAGDDVVFDTVEDAKKFIDEVAE